MNKAGYLQRAGCVVLDDQGIPCEIVVLQIRGIRLGIRVAEFSAALSGRLAARVERIHQNWKPYMEGVAGMASRSRSGKALNIELIDGSLFTVSLDSAGFVLTRRERYASVAEVPVPFRSERPRGSHFTDQQRLPGLA
jgi:hypothetical protein